jgi:hypothetical protein
LGRVLRPGNRCTRIKAKKHKFAREAIEFVGGEYGVSPLFDASREQRILAKRLQFGSRSAIEIDDFRGDEPRVVGSKKQRSVGYVLRIAGSREQLAYLEVAPKDVFAGFGREQ